MGQRSQQRPVVELGRRKKQKLLPTHSPDGVDLTLIRWMLSLTPAERLRVLQASVRSILRLRAAKTGS